jgi:hypothetical protein
VLRAVVVLALVVAGSVFPSVPSSSEAASDPDDVGGRLDLRRLVALKDDASAPLRITVTTWGSWTASVLARSGPNRLFVDLDTDLDGSADVRARITRSGGRLVVQLLRSGQVVRQLTAAHPTTHRVRFTVPAGAPGNPAGSIAAAARSRFRNDAGCDPCSDRGPDSGWVTVQPGDGGGGDFTCTQVIGFSQTRQWFLDAPDFEDVVGSAGWQLLWRGGGEIDLWADPDYRGWLEPIRSPCAAGEEAPDRVVLTISKQVFEDDPDVWARDIRAAVETVRDKYPSVERVVLQPVVGGPGHDECTYQGNPVRASVNHPTIDQAIADVVGGDVVAGASPEVRTCDDYQDTPGHLTDDADGPIGRAIGEFYD